VCVQEMLKFRYL